MRRQTAAPSTEGGRGLRRSDGATDRAGLSGTHRSAGHNLKPVLMWLCTASLGLTSFAACSSDDQGDAAQAPIGMGGADGMGTPTGGSGPGMGGGAALPENPVTGTQLRLRLLTQAEYMATANNLLGGNLAPVKLPEDNVFGGFVSLATSKESLSPAAVGEYGSASRDIASQIFSDEARWKAFVGCEPLPALNGACTSDFIARFGRLAFRRALTPEEVTKWSSTAQELVTISNDPALALQELTASLLQSPYFLYRFETGFGDGTSERYQLDGYSLAARLSFLLTGAGPSDALLTAAEQGMLNTADGVRQAAAPLLASENSSEHLAHFFLEYVGVMGLDRLNKSGEFETFNDELRTSLRTEVDLFIRDIVLAPGADVMAMFDSPRGYINGPLAAYYEVDMPGSGADFQPYDFPPESGRAGIASKGGVLAAHSGAETSSPTRRGNFILSNLLCSAPPPPPAGVDTTLPDATVDAPRTTRQRFEQHQQMPLCAGCHGVVDPYGFVLEHFDAIGRYRADENGLPIDATAMVGDTPVDGAVEFGALLRTDSRGVGCLSERFGIYANGTADVDKAALEALVESSQGSALVWREFLSNYVGSSEFLTAPVDSRTPPAETETP